MAECRYCNQEMTLTVSCSVTALHRDGVSFPLPPYGAERRYGPDDYEDPPRCGDCGAPLGGFHHLGCDMAECPNCRGQMISCGCRFDEDGDDEDDEDGFAYVVAALAFDSYYWDDDYDEDEDDDFVYAGLETR